MIKLTHKPIQPNHKKSNSKTERMISPSPLYPLLLPFYPLHSQCFLPAMTIHPYIQTFACLDPAH